MKKRLAFNLVIQLIALIVIVSFGFFILNNLQTKEIEKNTLDKARLYSSILGANVNKILDDNLKSYRSLKSVTVHLDEIESQVRRIRVISLDRMILSSSKDEQAGRNMESHFLKLIDDILKDKAPGSLIQKVGTNEFVIHFFPIMSGNGSQALIGILQVDVIVPKGQGTVAAALRSGKKGYFRKESGEYAHKLSNELQTFLKEAQRNAGYLRELIDNMVEDKDIESIQIYSREMDMLIAAGNKQALSFIEQIQTGLQARAISQRQTVISDVNRKKDMLDVASPIMITDGLNRYAGGAVSIKFSLKSMRRLIRQRKSNHLMMNGAIALMIILIVGIFFERKILIPINELVELTHAIKKGELGYRSENKSDDELGELARAFNSMIDEIERSRKDIEDWNVRLQERVDAVSEELKIKSEQLLETEKMASLGILSGGIAHEINNPIGVILGQTQMLLKEARSKKGITDQREAEELLAGIEEQARRCSQIVKSLLQFTKKRDMEFKPVNLAHVIKNALNFLKERIEKKGADFSLKAADDLPEVSGDPIALEQVFINVLNNALQSLQKGNPKIDISLLCEKDKDGKPKLVVTVEDNGCGIGKDDLTKIFDPFFSTKEPGEGSGLGLSISYGIIKAHGGDITVNSNINQGTLVKIYLPFKEG